MKYKRLTNSYISPIKGVINGLPHINSPEFLKAFYPDYYKCNTIAYYNNLACFLDKEITRKELSRRLGYEVKRPRAAIRREYNQLTIELNIKAFREFYRMIETREIQIIE
jgi:hypothetical protein